MFIARRIATILVLLAAASPALGQTMQTHHGAASTDMLAMPGQDAFGAIQEIVRILEANPRTDWSKVNLAALREHLIDMNRVTLSTTALLSPSRAAAAP